MRNGIRDNDTYQNKNMKQYKMIYWPGFIVNFLLTCINKEANRYQ